MPAYLHRLDFLPPHLLEDARYVARHQRARFLATQVTPPREGFRQSMLLGADDFVDLHEAFRVHLWGHLPGVLKHLKYTLPAATLELQLTRHGDGDYFRKHNDCGSDSTQHRRISFVCYFGVGGAAFSGGELKLYRGVAYQLRRRGVLRIFSPFPTVVQPVNNSCVFFNARMTHEVSDVMAGPAWEDGRFALTGWLCAPRKEL